jgi:hypothetical protein
MTVSGLTMIKTSRQFLQSFARMTGEESISPTKLRPFGGSIENGKLLAKSKDFRREPQSGRNQAADQVKES